MRIIALTALVLGVALAGCVEEPTQTPAESTAKELDPDVLQNATQLLSNVTAGAAILGEPTVGEPFQIIITTPGQSSWAFVAQNWSLTGKTDTGGTFAFDASAFPTAGPKTIQWAVRGAASAEGNFSFDVWGTPIVFPAEPSAQHVIRPGMYSEVCTTNFIFQYKWYRLFIGTAAHCADSADGGQCMETEMDYGSTETLEGDIQVTRAWSSWNLMNDVGVCFGANDFALFEIDPKDWDKVHPKAYGAMGHVMGLGDCRDLEPNVAYGGSSTDLELKSYGRSSLRSPGVRSAPDDPRNDKVGEFLEVDSEDFQCHVYYNSPGIPGDSGGPLATLDGLALGAASTITIAPTAGSNHYTNIATSLEFMAKHEGWAPNVVASA